MRYAAGSLRAETGLSMMAEGNEIDITFHDDNLHVFDAAGQRTGGTVIPADHKDKERKPRERDMKLFSTTGLGLATAMAAGLAARSAETELTMYYPIAVGGALTEVVDGIVADFEAANPDIKVNAIYSGNYDDTRVRALSALASGEPAQLAVMFSIDAYDLIEQELILPFEEVATTDADKEWLNSFYPALMANGLIEGQTWGIPFQRSTIVAYYNKDMFRAAGLDPEAPPTTWDEMIAMGKALTQGDTYGLMIPSTGYPYWMFQALAIQNGKEVMSERRSDHIL